MNSLPKILLICFLIAVGLAVAGALTVEAAVKKHGMMTIEVHERGWGGEHVYIPVPALFLRLVGESVTASTLIPRLDDAPEDAGEVIRAVLEEIEACPDMTLLEVVGSDDEIVQIVKRNGGVIVQVTSDDAVVKIHVPRQALAGIQRAFRG